MLIQAFLCKGLSYAIVQFSKPREVSEKDAILFICEFILVPTDYFC